MCVYVIITLPVLLYLASTGHCTVDLPVNNIIVCHKR